MCYLSLSCFVFLLVQGFLWWRTPLQAALKSNQKSVRRGTKEHLKQQNQAENSSFSFVYLGLVENMWGDAHPHSCFGERQEERGSPPGNRWRGTDCNATTTARIQPAEFQQHLTFYCSRLKQDCKLNLLFIACGPHLQAEKREKSAVNVTSVFFLQNGSHQYVWF